MNSSVQNENIIICLEGRIDTNNAAEVEKEIGDIITANAGLTPVFDAKELKYISSAGLRVLMKFTKQAGKKLKVQNVSKDVYDIFETTGFTTILEVSKVLREISVEGCELIGSGGYGKVYRIDPETIVKVYNPTISLDMVQLERNVAQKAFLKGVPTAISFDVVKCSDSYGVVFELLDAKTVAQIIDKDPSLVREMGKKSAEMLKSIHNIVVEDEALPSRKSEALEWHKKIAPYLTQEEADEILTFIQNMPDSKTFLHGDFNSKNIMVNGDEFLLIDIGDAACGHPVFDVAGLILAYLYLPQSKMPEEDRYHLLGFHLSDAAAMLNAMFSTYFGFDPADTAAMGKYIQMIMPYSQLLACYHGTRRVNFNPEYMKTMMTGAIRERLLPAIRSAIPLEWN
ncbi:MAG: anti-sigma factor antagonist [Treponema sp.]|nr:anti-sigma factor antagonist [Treponema sp.]